MLKIGILGLGKMGEALARGLIKKAADEYFIEASTRTAESAKEASRRLGIKCYTDNNELVSKSDIIVLCVKPYQARMVLEEIKNSLKKEQILISICAAVTTEQGLGWIEEKARFVRAMPNTPCLIGEGMTVLAKGRGSDEEHLKVAERIFGTVGKTAVIDEALMDGATGLSGCGPAYVYLAIEALSEAGVKVGLPRKTATLLAAQTLVGASKMVIERGVHPAELKDEVTTPAGCTIDGLMALEEGKLRVTLIKAVLAAAKRSRKLSR
ncbi:MAG: pyrroline-5-carboxylate reductase [Bdellovibrionales bacterium RIFOXYD1_FULL_44_7]|nr:MAG: pyrroline-5-carboxylate reductase [Bdellovibrionales bacterium RIFOXYD1_FULL_44_7]